MKELFDEHGRQLAWLEQLEPDWDGDLPENYGKANIFVTKFLEPGEEPPAPDDWLWNDSTGEDVVWTRREPNCVTSWCPETKQHRLVLDLDFECRLIPSSSPGCYHLYLDGLDLDGFSAGVLVKQLAVAGVLEDGFAKNMQRDGKLCVRATNVKKRQPKPPKGEGRKVTRLRVFNDVYGRPE